MEKKVIYLLNIVQLSFYSVRWWKKNKWVIYLEKRHNISNHIKLMKIGSNEDCDIVLNIGGEIDPFHVKLSKCLR